MKNLKTVIFLGVISISAQFLGACSDDTEKPASKAESTGDHVWKTQTDTLKSAKDMAKKMQESLKQQEQNMNESH